MALEREHDLSRIAVAISGVGETIRIPVGNRDRRMKWQRHEHDDRCRHETPMDAHSSTSAVTWVLTPAGRRGSPAIRSPGAPASFLGGTRSAIVRFSSVQFLQLLANGFRRQGKVLAVTHHLFLALPAQDVSKKFLYLGIDRFFRVAIDVEKHPRTWDRAGSGCFPGGARNSVRRPRLPGRRAWLSESDRR